MSAESSAMSSLITKPSMRASRPAPVELGQNVGFDLIQQLRRIDQQNHSAFRVQVRDAADQAHLLRRELRRRTNRVERTSS